MKKYNLEVKFEATAYCTIEAESLNDAEKKAEEELHVFGMAQILKDGNYIIDFEEFDPENFYGVALPRSK